MYDTFLNDYDGFQTKLFDCQLRTFEIGDLLPIEELAVVWNQSIIKLPKTCIIKFKAFNDESIEYKQYIHILIKNKRYVGYYYNVKDIEGRFEVYKTYGFPDQYLRYVYTYD